MPTVRPAILGRMKLFFYSKSPIYAFTRALKATIFFEAGAAILFFGALVHHPELIHSGASALRDLQTLGYTVPSDADPVRVYPAATAGSFDSSHAGGWHPGIISLREAPQGSLGAEIYLRHELMHEASFRTCSGKLPLWAEEAAAMHFSGELSNLPPPESPTEEDLDYLRARIRISSSLDPRSHRTLSKLVASYGWPQAPCAVSEEIQKLVSPPALAANTGFSYILISLLSGRVLESMGDLDSRHPPGSVLKIAYAAALRGGSPDAIGEELAASDTEKLLARRSSVDPGRFRFLISPVHGTPLAQDVPAEELARKDERFWRRYLGERSEDGTFPFEAGLRELALVLRTSLLLKPERFSGLVRNGLIEGSTLYHASPHDKAILEKLHAMAKTGTASDERGIPLVGHLMVAWPVEDPVYLAVFRSGGANGASNLRKASKLLDEWSTSHPVSSGNVRVRLMSLTPRSSWEIVDECPSFEKDGPSGWRVRISTCGRFRILSSAKGSRSERFVSGIVNSSPDGGQVVLETDAETYADGVLAREAQELQGEARSALRAVIVWNAVHGSTRHQETSSLCDSTHCMVFQGDCTEIPIEQSPATDPHLLKLLDKLSGTHQLDWLPFSKGGNDKWERKKSALELKRLADEPDILDIRRNRSRSGEVSIHLIYPESEEVVPCETFRNKLKLPSCPDSIRSDDGAAGWIFEGMGAGHGTGLSVERARALGESGTTGSAILKDAYERAQPRSAQDTEQAY